MLRVKNTGATQLIVAGEPLPRINALNHACVYPDRVPYIWMFLYQQRFHMKSPIEKCVNFIIIYFWLFLSHLGADNRIAMVVKLYPPSVTMFKSTLTWALNHISGHYPVLILHSEPESIIAALVSINIQLFYNVIAFLYILKVEWTSVKASYKTYPFEHL